MACKFYSLNMLQRMHHLEFFMGNLSCRNWETSSRKYTSSSKASSNSLKAIRSFRV
uniref:Histone deacetylase hda1 n=1 Tax=Rhizophora mucronata TaxID=61149 RepID=A0A2P2L5R6_RHIMU